MSALVSALAEDLFALGSSVEAAKVGTEHEGHLGWSMSSSSGRPGRVQCGCGRSLDEILGLPPMMVWYMAVCHGCGMSIPFRDATERDDWATAHGGSAGHRVTRREVWR